jgi:flagellar motor switch protein FliN/FliY
MLWWEQSINAAEGARFFVGAPEASWTALGRHILNAAGIEEADAAETRSTFLELAGQSLEGLANAIGARLGREVVCPARAERPGPPASGECYLVDVNLEGLAPILLVAVPGAELVGALAPPGQPAATGQAPESAHAAGQPAASPDASPMLDLLLDVELPVSISFGRTHLPLKEALKLTTGSIVELNRTVSEPVEIIVNNCVIARGEVVVIEGNYGVRIREIMSREARLSNLR